MTPPLTTLAELARKVIEARTNAVTYSSTCFWADALDSFRNACTPETIKILSNAPFRVAPSRRKGREIVALIAKADSQ